MILTLSCRWKALFPWQKGREKGSNCTKRNLKQISTMPLQPLSDTTVHRFYFILWILALANKNKNPGQLTPRMFGKKLWILALANKNKNPGQLTPRMFVKKSAEVDRFGGKKFSNCHYLDNGYQSCQTWRKDILKLTCLDNRFQEVAKMQQYS